MTARTAIENRLTGFDYGIKTAACLRPATMDIEVYDRPHPSPAMERALQRIETEIPVRMKALREHPRIDPTEYERAA